MKKVDATPMDCLVCECPYCGKEVIELGQDMRESWEPDVFDDENELTCPFCKRDFIAVVGEY